MQAKEQGLQPHNSEKGTFPGPFRGLPPWSPSQPFPDRCPAPPTRRGHQALEGFGSAPAVGPAIFEPALTQGLCELGGEAHKLQKFSRCPGKPRASRAWAGLYLISLHSQARPFPTAGLGCPSQGESQELTCPSGACQSPSPWGTEELGISKRHVQAIWPTLSMQMRKCRPSAWELGARSRRRAASPDAVPLTLSGVTRNSLVVESDEKRQNSGGSFPDP